MTRAIGANGMHDRVDRVRFGIQRRTTSGREKGQGGMATYLIFHEVDDVQHWLSSPVRDEFFGPRGITHRTFHDPDGSNRVGLILEIPNLDEFQEMLQSEEAAAAMKQDGVHPDTLLLLAEG